MSVTSPLTWNEQLALDNRRMDQTHQEFVDLVERIYQSEGEAELAALDELIAHTEAHFEMEERWMDLTGFARDNCHSKQHNMVLTLMREVARRAREGEQSFVKRLAEELTTWLPDHVDMMDAALAFHCQQVTFDCDTETFTDPSKQPGPAHESTSGCGSDSCA